MRAEGIEEVKGLLVFLRPSAAMVFKESVKVTLVKERK